MVPDRFAADVQGGGDLGVASPVGKQLEDLALTVGQSVRIGRRIGAPGGRGSSAQRGQSVLGPAGRRRGAELAEGGQRGLHRVDVATELGQRGVVGAAAIAPRIYGGLPVPVDLQFVGGDGIVAIGLAGGAG